MPGEWVWNFTQVHLERFMTEDDMRSIAYPYGELAIHIGFKNVEAGALIGGLVVAPLWHRFRDRQDIWSSKLKLHHRMGICGRRGMLLGLLLTPVMEFAYLKARNIDEAGVRDRCYRLRYNKKQLTIDRMVLISSIFGWVSKRWPGVVILVCGSVIVTTIYNALLFDRLRHFTAFGGDQMEVPDENYKPRRI